MDECDVLVRYLVKVPPSTGIRNLYYHTLQNFPIVFSEKQQRLWHVCLKKKWQLPYVDAYLAFKEPDHPIRKKIFIVTALLETQPEYSSFFLPSKGSFFEPALLLFRVIYALIKIGIGRVVLWII
jgi:hypothetical protein